MSPIFDLEGIQRDEESKETLAEQVEKREEVEEAQEQAHVEEVYDSHWRDEKIRKNIEDMLKANWRGKR